MPNSSSIGSLGVENGDRSLTNLIRDARQGGDESAWQALYAHTDPELRRTVSVVLGPGWYHDSVSDLVQDGWVRIRNGLDGFRGAEREDDLRVVYLAWVRKIIRRVIQDRRGKIRPFPTGQLPAGSDGYLCPADPDPSVGYCLGLAEQRDHVRLAVANLPDALDRDVIGLRFFHERTMGEIAEKLGLTYDEVRGRTSRALYALGRVLGGRDA
jgi:RNA polymerase sigma factor (sigma-70 family)